jgi:uncharacterized protein YjbJ (UPF0337 family)
MTDQEIEGKGKQAKGKIREGIGELTGDKSEQVEGKVEQAEGKVRETIGKAERKSKEET